MLCDICLEYLQNSKTTVLVGFRCIIYYLFFLLTIVNVRSILFFQLICNKSFKIAKENVRLSL